MCVAISLNQSSVSTELKSMIDRDDNVTVMYFDKQAIGVMAPSCHPIRALSIHVIGTDHYRYLGQVVTAPHHVYHGFCHRTIPEISPADNQPLQTNTVTNTRHALYSSLNLLHSIGFWYHSTRLL